MVEIHKEISKQTKNGVVSVLSDIWPHIDAWKRLTKMCPMLTYAQESVDATQIDASRLKLCSQHTGIQVIYVCLCVCVCFWKDVSTFFFCLFYISQKKKNK